ncbi:MAG TPA: PHP-associated domain-containing protein [Dehalococcoidia bacterium]|jgi:predicted metal-dependent phosphoesterase TrpH|nr:PHP-associated domain-containing protein [Dehalococcoidia bacterium]
MQATIMDMHCHTMGASSDSMLDPEELPEIAAAAGLSGINISEHDQIWDRGKQSAYKGRHPDFFANFGLEVSTELGHMLAVGLPEYVGGIQKAERLREELDKIGGFLIVAHPFRHVFDPVTAMRKGEEPFNLTVEEAAQLPVFKVVHAIEVSNASNTPQENEFAYEVAMVNRLPRIGGSDAHSKSGVGNFATGFEREFKTATELIEELHAGRFEAVHRTKSGRVVRFQTGSLDAAQAEGS